MQYILHFVENCKNKQQSLKMQKSCCQQLETNMIYKD